MRSANLLPLACFTLLLTVGPAWAQTGSDPATPRPPTDSAGSQSGSLADEEASLPPAPTPNLAGTPSADPAQSSSSSQPPASASQQPSGTGQKPADSLSLQDLGFAPTQTQSNAQLQAQLNKRTHMLKVHQTLGLITTAPMLATLITGPMAKAKGKNGQPITEPTSANLDFHIALGGVATGMYWTTAYYAMFAPRIPGVKPKGAIRVHKALVWVHAPGMVLTPILGIMAYKQENAGEKVHGIASAHGPVAFVTVGAYCASIVAVSWPIHWKFWEKNG